MNLDPRAMDQVLRSHLAPTLDAIGDTATAAAIQAAVRTRRGDSYDGAFGRLHLEPHPDTTAPPVTTDTPFDIASLTKLLVGATLAMIAVDEGRVAWDTPIADILPLWARRTDRPSSDVTFLHVLNHTSGLPAWRKFYLRYPLSPTPAQARQTRQAILEEICDTPLDGPPGTVYSYSDLGFLLLRTILETLFDAPLGALAKEKIFAPLDLSASFVDIDADAHPVDQAPATERCELRGRLVQGTVHDENTEIIGGVSTHAGVFTTASELARFGEHLLAIDDGRAKAPLISQDTLRFAWSPQAGSSIGAHRGGWDTPSGATSSAGRGFSRDHTVGHLGFTGTSLWIERDRGVVSVLLSNRVYPTRENPRIRDLRIAFQEAVLPPTASP